MVLSFEDSRGRASGKVRMVVKLSNAATNEYDATHSVDEAQLLGMDGASVDGGRNLNSYANQSHTGTRGAGAGAGTGASAVGPGSITGVGGISGAISVAGSVPGVSYGKDFDYLLQSQVEAVNELANVPVLHMVLSGIAVIDLRAVHTFAPNSPSVNLACGKIVATTPVRVFYVCGESFISLMLHLSVMIVQCCMTLMFFSFTALLSRLRRTRARWLTGRT